MVAFQVHISQTVPGLGHSHFRRFANQTNAFVWIFRQAKLLNVHEAKKRNAERLALLGCGGDPARGALNVSLGAHAVAFHHAHPIQCLHIAQIRRQPELPICQLGVSGKPSARFIAQPENCQ